MELREGLADWPKSAEEQCHPTSGALICPSECQEQLASEQLCLDVGMRCCSASLHQMHFCLPALTHPHATTASIR